MNMICPWCRANIDIAHSATQSPCCSKPVRFSMDDYEEGPAFFLHRDPPLPSSDELLLGKAARLAEKIINDAWTMRDPPETRLRLQNLRDAVGREIRAIKR